MRSLFSFQKLEVHLSLGVSQRCAFEFFGCWFVFFFSLRGSYTSPKCSIMFI